MKTSIKVYDNIRHLVRFFYKQLGLGRHEKKTGRPLALSREEAIALALFKQKNNIATKKSVYDIFDPACSYKTLVESLNRASVFSLLILTALMKWNRQNAHIVKHTDATDLPACLVKNARHHKTMRGLASWGHSGKGWFYGVKLHITCDLEKRLLSVKFSPGNTADVSMFLKLNKDLLGIFAADAAYISEKLSHEFGKDGTRVLFARPRANMKKIMTKFQEAIYGTRMVIETNFRSLKLFYGMVTSLPRSVNGYLANYIHSLLAYQIA
jgi:hypothetical protein